MEQVYFSECPECGGWSVDPETRFCIECGCGYAGKTPVGLSGLNFGDYDPWGGHSMEVSEPPNGDESRDDGLPLDALVWRAGAGQARCRREAAERGWWERIGHPVLRIGTTLREPGDPQVDPPLPLTDVIL